MKRCCPERLPERGEKPSEEKEQARRDACGDDSWISQEEVYAGAAQSVEAMEDPLLRQVLRLRFGFDNGTRRTPAEVADALGGKYKGKPQIALQLIREALRSIPLVADDPTDLHVLYEDDELVALAKPPFLRSTPVHRFVGKSLTNQLVGYMQQRSARVAAAGGGELGEAAGGGGRPSAPAETPMMLHRLDQGTSGVVLCAKTKGAAAFMHEHWHGPRCQKEYLALAARAPDAQLLADVGAELLVRAPIGRDAASSDPVRRAVNYEEGQSAATRFRVLASGATCDGIEMVLMSCILEESGRTHQIRVHAAHAGVPLVGDGMYGGLVASDQAADAAAAAATTSVVPGRVALHAWRLRVPQPQSGAELLIEAPLPDDLRRCLEPCGMSWPPLQ